MLQNHLPAVYHRSIKYCVSRKRDPNANDVPQILGFNPNPNLNPACWRSQDWPEMTTLFAGLKLQSSHGWKIKTPTHRHTHHQIRGKGRRVDTEQHRGRLNQPGYGGRVPSFPSHSENKKYQWGRHGNRGGISSFRDRWRHSDRPRSVSTGGTASSNIDSSKLNREASLKEK